MHPEDIRFIEEQERLKVVGQDAQRLLGDPTFAGLIEELLAHYSAQLFATDPRDAATRETYYQQHVAVQTLRDILRARVAAGKAAEDLLRAEELGVEA